MEGAPARVQLRRLRRLACCMCERAPAGAMWFPVTERGVCHGCARRAPLEADGWRRVQSRREQAAHAARDGRLRDTLAAALGPHLPPRLYRRELRLLFSSDRMGGSVSVLLQKADGADASLLLVRERGDGGDVREFGALCPVPWPRAGRGASGRRAAFPGARTGHAVEPGFFGTSEAFVFALRPPPPAAAVGSGSSADRASTAAAPAASSATATIFAATGRDANYLSVSSESGIRVGGDACLPGLFIAADFGSGRCWPCHTYGDTSTLASASDFEVECVQLWALALPEGEEEEESTARATAALPKDSVLQARRADAVLLPFVGIERQVSGMRI